MFVHYKIATLCQPPGQSGKTLDYSSPMSTQEDGQRKQHCSTDGLHHPLMTKFLIYKNVVRVMIVYLQSAVKILYGLRTN